MAHKEKTNVRKINKNSNSVPSILIFRLPYRSCLTERQAPAIKSSEHKPHSEL